MGRQTLGHGGDHGHLVGFVEDVPHHSHQVGLQVPDIVQQDPVPLPKLLGVEVGDHGDAVSIKPVRGTGDGDGLAGQPILLPPEAIPPAGPAPAPWSPAGSGIPGGGDGGGGGDIVRSNRIL